MVDKKYSFLFPGQGAQYPGMGKDLFEQSSAVKDLFKLASDKTGKDLAGILFEGSAEDLKATDNTQLGITLINLAVAAVLKENGIESSSSAGFSLGEYAAMVDAGVISIEDIFPMVLKRGELMQAACNSSAKEYGETGMAAVMGMAPEKVAETLASSGVENVYGANYNSPIQVVITGTKAAIEQVSPVLKEAGARRIIPLKVAGAFHSPLMKSAADEFTSFLEGITFSNPVKPFYSNVTGKAEESAEEIKRLCPLQIISPVKWTDIEAALASAGTEICIESGPGTVLKGLWAKSGFKDIPCSSAGKWDELQNIFNPTQD